MSDIIFLVLRRLRLPLIILVLVYSVATIGMTLIWGVDDQGNPWKMDLFHAFYFVSFMGSTIGFGEIPYPFTQAQRIWVLLCIYTSVVSWLYAIGSILTLIQDPAFQLAISRQRFARLIARINQPFYIICGYGQTGSLLNKGLTQLGIQTVVIEHKAEPLYKAQLDEFALPFISLQADATISDNLITAGIKQAECLGVISLTPNDHRNLQIAVSAKLINPEVKAICRAVSSDEESNMRSFNTDHVINPNKLFAHSLQ